MGTFAHGTCVGSGSVVDGEVEDVFDRGGCSFVECFELYIAYDKTYLKYTKVVRKVVVLWVCFE